MSYVRIEAAPVEPSKPRYHTRGWNLIFREVGTFFATAFGSLLTREFLTVIIPLIGLWELIPRLGLVPPKLVPPFSQVLAAGWELITQGYGAMTIGAHLYYSVSRLLIGLALAIAVGFPVGVLMGWNLYIRKHVLPLVQLLAPVPPPAWVPLTMMVFGIGLRMKLFLIFIGALYPILLNTYQGVKETDPRYLASARVFGASEWTLIWRVYIPHALGSVIMGVKIGIAVGLIMLVTAELFGSTEGIGYILHYSRECFRMDIMVVCMVILGAIGWFLIEIMKYIEVKLALWRVGR